MLRLSRNGGPSVERVSRELLGFTPPHPRTYSYSSPFFHFLILLWFRILPYFQFFLPVVFVIRTYLKTFSGTYQSSLIAVGRSLVTACRIIFLKRAIQLSRMWIQLHLDRFCKGCVVDRSSLRLSGYTQS
ncbi:hypothetical protein BDV35DRAFT_383868 [Aspergillus flavus]|uniref:DNA, SC113 n=3 Tax=Aspergillus subgen. Circumdati TaxID=2720871 RepID=Q2U6D3_ASPOR|nr:unnamed protein product [Aspergillus oryzae RIB40]EIT78535.1 hypothetical protein Ao3042_05195 [Aspergillus oryzae 3.042]KAB8242625.1 hypothetical protein BDV35DRAFT_383868 [Aspergillus flavus]KDE83198.1 hypothetical protein AO1008_09701 [Aspergillus oryzae 100-8]BAE62882.1 unnamed protein product [Aspergillus oryzae RIB40]|eukprot:EIT78535.1 hypothetical protein Ao3042_05195 [Aspergillus oryzae 3.042]